VVADPLVRVDDDGRQSAPPEVVGGRQARLAGADDQRVDPLGRRLGCHRAPPGS
jgi:hypothetical protein